MDDRISSQLLFFVNGKKVIDNNVNPEWTLLYYLRNKLRLCGTKMGCSEGGCGACTVMLSKYTRREDKITHLAINACLAPVCSMHGLAVTTVEGIGNTKTKLHPVQERIAKSHGTQCGFCTPGMVMSMYALLRNNQTPSMKDLQTTFQGNLCRCTGYRPIIEGYRTFVDNVDTNGCAMGENCCKLKNGKEMSTQNDADLFDKSEFVPYDPSQEPIFPPELKIETKYDKEYLQFFGTNVTWLRPTNIDDLLKLKCKYPEAKIIAGNTEVGVENKLKNYQYPILLCPSEIKELSAVNVLEKGLQFGASITLSNLQLLLSDVIKTYPENRTRIFKAIIKILDQFAGTQIRNVASIVGNIMTSSPISDLNPIFVASNTEVELQSIKHGRRTVKMDQDFFTGYRKNIVKNHEILTSILIPFSEENLHFDAYKQSRRRDDDIAIVTAAFSVRMFSKNMIEDIQLVFGGMSSKIVVANKTKKEHKNCEWNENLLHSVYKTMIEDLPLANDAPGGMAQYRKSLCLSMFFKFFLGISNMLNIKLLKSDSSAIECFQTTEYKSSQYFQIVPKTQEKINSIGRPIVHISAKKHATGEAIYTDDMPKIEGELYMALVLSTRAHAEILHIDSTLALQTKGVQAFFSAKDIEKSRNKWGPIEKNEEIFVSKTVTSHGQILGAIIADDELVAKKAAKMVEVKYKDIVPVILTIEDAIKYNSFFDGSPYTLVNGQVDQAFKIADHILKGKCRTGSQDHFYMETQNALVIPSSEDDEMVIYSSTQNTSVTSRLVGDMLNIPYNKIVTKVKRIGGGFGGKDSRPFLVVLPAAFAAKHLGKPIRCVLDRDQDMIMTGLRHPFLCKYKVAFDKEGKILGYDLKMYSNAGYSMDVSFEVMLRALLCSDGPYRIPSIRAACYVCKTNLCSNTAIRGFGAPQSMFAVENAIRDIAEFLNKNTVDVCRLNLCQEGDVTFYNQKLIRCTMETCWQECLKMSQYHRRLLDINKFNKENRWKKRGLAVVPTKFGVGFYCKFLNQAGALVLVYADGSVLLSHGGMEMGQGLHTKMIQIASRVLEIAVDKIHISETSTDKVPNTIPTSASVSSDLNGMAVLNACETIKTRLKPYKLRDPEGNWERWVSSAYLDRVSLSATGFYKTPDVGWDPVTNTGLPFNYYTYGTACTEVEIDCLTGDHRMLRTDIVMDLGDSLNPAIDVGQIEGAFMQGYGLFMLEEVIYLSNGAIFSRGPGTYKIPSFSDIPIELNVSLLRGSSNPRAVYSSKAVGEPPLFLASSALFAAREAIKEARKDAGVPTSFRLNAPATAAAIRMACEDEITKKVHSSTSCKTWNIVP